jgi:hypothetical protein
MAALFAAGVGQTGYNAYVTNFNTQRDLGVFSDACAADSKARCGTIEPLRRSEYVQVVTGLALLGQKGGDGPWASNMLYYLLAAGRFAVNSMMYADVGWVFRADALHSVVWTNRNALGQVRDDNWVAHYLAHEAAHFWFWGPQDPGWQDDCRAEHWAKGITGLFDPNECSGG